MEDGISVWEREGGSLTETSENAITGTPNQVEWANQIKKQANTEFDRVKTLPEAAAARQSGRRSNRNACNACTPSRKARRSDGA